MKNLSILLLTILLVSCSGSRGSFSTAKDSGTSGLAYDEVDYLLEISNGPYQGKTVVDNIRHSNMNITFPIGFNSSVPLGTVSVPQEIAGVKITDDGTGFKTAEIQISTSEILQGVNVPTVTQLPNGDAFDSSVPTPIQHFSYPLDPVGNVLLHLYFSPPYLVGVFIQTPFDLASSNRYSVVPHGSLMEAGFFSTHPHHPPLNGGAFLFISLPH